MVPCRSVCRQWNEFLKAHTPEALHGFKLPAVAHVAMHWGMFSERGVLMTHSWHERSELLWITDPDSDHGDWDGQHEGCCISASEAYHLWKALLEKVQLWHGSQGQRHPFGQGLEVCRLQLGAAASNNNSKNQVVVEVSQPNSARRSPWDLEKFESDTSSASNLTGFKELCYEAMARCCSSTGTPNCRCKLGREDGQRLLKMCPFAACPQDLPVQPASVFQAHQQPAQVGS
ncbi:unnamed protein product [Polarella glacialis]|uniref:Uncharacterized protein n=1 Tax=Polarella glacialis TaxID=89957 RepID=A0A813G4L5_POLGL|nr:unnamed protein product [Polarella glacialis]